MKKVMVIVPHVVVALALMGLLNGCAAFRMSVDDKAPTGSEKLTAKYDQNDLLTLAKQASEALLAAPFPGPNETKPLVVEMGIQNRTKSHLDTKALADTMTTILLDSKQVRFADASLRDNLLKEQGYQLANCTPETRRSIGKQLGAKYMLTGAITEIETESGKQVRVSKKQDVYLQLTVELTDIETGEITVRKQVERMREASKPIIGW
jgi:uncharacterized protein (TIGR02722 family)